MQTTIEEVDSAALVAVWSWLMNPFSLFYVSFL